MKLYILLFILLLSITTFSQTNPVPAITIGEPVSPDTVITNTSKEENTNEETTTESEDSDKPTISIINSDENSETDTNKESEINKSS